MMDRTMRCGHAARTFLFFILSFPALRGQQAPASGGEAAALKKLSLEQLSQIEVTTPSKEPESGIPDPRGDLRHHRRGHPPFGRHHAFPKRFGSRQAWKSRGSTAANGRSEFAASERGFRAPCWY